MRWLRGLGMGTIARLIALIALVVAVVAPSRAALFDDDEARKRIAETNARITQLQQSLDERIAALENQLKSQGLVDLYNAVESLKAESARLRGQIEVLVYEMNESSKRQRDLYVDLDTRMRKIEAATTAAADSTGAAGASAAGAATPGPVASAADVAAEQRAYDAALDQFKGGNYAASIASFNAFIKSNPKSPLAASAQYWIGNAQFAQKDYRAAIAAQRQLIATYADSQKVPDAMLNIASSQYELGDVPASRKTLEDVVAKYPQSEAAAKAKQRLATR